MNLKHKIAELAEQAESFIGECESDLAKPDNVFRYGQIVKNEHFLKGYKFACREILQIIIDDEKERKEVKKNGGKKGRDANQGS